MTATTYHVSYLGVVFDLDGTLVESRHDFRTMRAAVKSLAEKAGIPPGELHTTMAIPQIMAYTMDRLRQLGLSDGVRYKFEADANRLLDDMELKALPTTKIRAGSVPFLERLSGEGYRLGLLTRSSARFTEQVLHGTGLRPLFRAVRTRSDPGPSKPDPEALLRLLKEMMVSPDRAVYVGDHPLDLECAIAARVDFIGLVHPSPPGPKGAEEELRRRGARVVVRSFEDLRHAITGQA